MRAIGTRFLIVGLLALLMFIPLFFVSAVIDDRAQFSRETIREVGREWGGSQLLSGPVLIIPVEGPVSFSETVAVTDPQTGETRQENRTRTEIRPKAPVHLLPVTFDLDIETPFVGADPAVVARPGFLSQARYAPRVGVPLILALLEDLDVAATFFIPGKSAEDFADTVRLIAGSGHEIAAHGYTHVAPSGLTREEERDQLERTLEILGGFGADVVGYRAPFFEASTNTVDLLGEYGLRYASGMMDEIRPYRYPDTDVIELPSQWLMDDWSVFGHGTDDGLARIAPCAHVRRLWIEEFEALHRLGGLMVLTMHPQVTGRPARLEMLAGLVAEMRDHDGVWMTDCRTIADHAAATL